jgi:hypothetical protein
LPTGQRTPSGTLQFPLSTDVKMVKYADVYAKTHRRDSTGGFKIMLKRMENIKQPSFS